MMSQQSVLIKYISSILPLLFLSFPSFADNNLTYQAMNPVTDNQITCVATNNLACYLSVNGEKLWENEDINDSHGLILINELLYLTQDNSVKVFQAHNGTLLHSFDHPGTLFDPVITSNLLILTSQQGHVSALNSTNGNLIWQRKLDSGWVYPPAVAGNQLITGGQSGILWSLNLNNGKTLWQKKLPNELVYRPVTSSAGLIVSTFDGIVRTLSSQTGELLWETPLSTALFNIKTESSGKIISSGYDGKLFALDAYSGKLIWQTQAFSTARFQYTSSVQHTASIDHLGLFKLFDNQSGVLLKELKIEGSHQVSPLMAHSTIWIFPDESPAVQLQLNNNDFI